MEKYKENIMSKLKCILVLSALTTPSHTMYHSNSQEILVYSLRSTDQLVLVVVGEQCEGHIP